MSAGLLHDLFDDPLLANVPAHEGYKVLGGVVLYQKLGAGGMGAVYRGRHLRLDIDVALKVTALPAGTPPERAGDFVKRFIREARTAAAVRHPNLIRVYDVNAEAGVHYLIMDYVEGESAADRLERRAASGEGRLSEQEAVEICLGAAEGLAAAHSQGIVHRDVKPDNILIDKKGNVVVADLGLAKAFADEEGSAPPSVTQTRTGMGTPHYMAPEQFTSARSVGPPADVWSLGVMLYQLLTGALPWSDSSVFDLANKIRNDPLPDIGEARRDVSEGVRAIIERALKKEPEERFADCGEMERALRGHLDSLGADVKATLEPEADAASLALASLPLPPPETMTLIAEAALAETPPTVDMGGSVAATDSPSPEPTVPREEAVFARIRRAQQAIVRGGADSRVSESGFLRANELMQKARERAGDCAFDEAERLLVKVEEALGHAHRRARRPGRVKALVLAGVVVLAVAMPYFVGKARTSRQGRASKEERRAPLRRRVQDTRDGARLSGWENVSAPSMSTTDSPVAQPRIPYARAVRNEPSTALPASSKAGKLRLGWSRSSVPGFGTIDIPPSMEVAYGAKERLTDHVPGSFIVQQKGLNLGRSQARGTYFRIIISPVPESEALPGSLQELTEADLDAISRSFRSEIERQGQAQLSAAMDVATKRITSLNEADFRQFASELLASDPVRRQKLGQMTDAQWQEMRGVLAQTLRRNAFTKYKPRIISWGNLSVVSLDGREALCQQYVRQLGDNPPVVCTTYSLFGKACSHQIIVSFREKERGRWESAADDVLESIDLAAR